MQKYDISQKRLCKQHLQTLSEISVALGKKDSYTQAHCHRVALYAMRLAGRLGFSATEDIRSVGIGGYFHDVGKLALSDQIFTNRETGLLSFDLQQEVRCHPLIGAALLKDIDFLKPAVDFVLFHHEREDGQGYPFGLRAGEIPPGAKDCQYCGLLSMQSPRTALISKDSRSRRPMKSFAKVVAAIFVKLTWRSLSKISKRTESFGTQAPSVHCSRMNWFVGYPPVFAV
jgi:putative nucleotidyltransferase with HDIG domain